MFVDLHSLHLLFSGWSSWSFIRSVRAALTVDLIAVPAATMYLVALGGGFTGESAFISVGVIAGMSAQSVSAPWDCEAPPQGMSGMDDVGIPYVLCFGVAGASVGLLDL